jgi:hypothetical protein
VCGDEFGDDGQAETGARARVGGGGLGLPEPVEGASGFVGTHAWSVIGDRKELDVLGAHLGPYSYPTAIAYLLIGDLLVGTVFQTGEFDALVTLQVWVVLACYAIGLLASTASRLLQSALYGIGDPRTPAKLAALRVVISVLLGVALMFQLDRVAVTAQGFAVVENLPAVGPLPDRVDVIAELVAAQLPDVDLPAEAELRRGGVSQVRVVFPDDRFAAWTMPVEQLFERLEHLRVAMIQPFV